MTISTPEMRLPPALAFVMLDWIDLSFGFRTSITSNPESDS
jgi:hypothetical protein